MSERALGFVEEWVAENVQAQDQTPASPTDSDDSRAKALAAQCLAEAGAQGITAGEIGEAIDDLTEFMTGAIAEANEREAHRLQDDDEDDDDDDDDDDEDEDDEENDENKKD